MPITTFSTSLPCTLTRGLFVAIAAMMLQRCSSADIDPDSAAGDRCTIALAWIADAIDRFGKAFIGKEEFLDILETQHNALPTEKRDGSPSYQNTADCIRAIYLVARESL